MTLAWVPFLFLTALADARDIVTGKRAGADDYLTKPIDYDLLLATVAARLDQVERMRAQAVRSLQDAADQAKRDALRLSTDTLNHVDIAIFLIARDHRVLFANRHGQSLLEAKDGLSGGPTGLLHAQTPAQTRALRDAVAAAAAGQDGPGPDGGETHVLLPRPSGDRPLVALVRPQPGGSDADLPAAAVLVTDPDRKAGLPPEVIARMYQLTPAETRVALAVADGHRPADIAEMQGTSRTTVVFHLRNVFRKTGTGRQAELVGLFRG